MVATGKGFVYTPGRLHYVKSAVHPPLWTLTLALFDRLGMHSWLSHQVVAALRRDRDDHRDGLRRLAHRRNRAGILAALIVAVTPTFFFYEWELVSETLATLGAVDPVARLPVPRPAEPRCCDGRRVDVWSPCADTLRAGLAGGRAARAPCPARRGVPTRTRWVWLAAATAVAIGVAVPWAAYNTARFQEPVLLSTQFGPTLADANCDSTYSGRNLGLANAKCRFGASFRLGPTKDESTQDSGLRRIVFKYIRGHLGRLPVVITAREGRAFGVFRPSQQMRFETTRGTPENYIRIGFFVTWALEIMAIVGVVVMRRRRISLCPILAFIAVVAIGIAFTFGGTRYRAPAEVSIVLLAAGRHRRRAPRLTRAL
jgi:hypothetical protein